MLAGVLKKLVELMKSFYAHLLRYRLHCRTPKSQIIGYAKTITNFVITILTLSNFEEELRNAGDRYSQVIKRFCPEVYEHKVGLIRKQAAETKLRLYKKYPLPLSLIEQVIDGQTKDTIGDLDVSVIEAEIALLKASRFIRQNLPQPNVVTRESVNHFLTREFAVGSTYVLLGVPKIGKTSWVAQLCQASHRGWLRDKLV